MEKKGLTLSIIFEANSANYSEGFGNFSTLKKLHRGDGNTYTYISRQALRYSLVKSLDWDKTSVTKDNKVVQFSPDATIKEYPEIDFFGYMKTKSGKNATTRSAVCRLSHAVSLEPYKSDLDYLTNMGMASRINAENAIAQSEIHKSLYAYTVTIDLDLVGIDGEINISNTEKSDRVKKLLKGIKLLHRDIKGRRENLSPLFIIGGIYNNKNPYFEGRLKVEKGQLNIDILKQVLNLDKDIQDNTMIGYAGGIFKNDEEITKLSTLEIGEFFELLNQKVENYYESN